MSSHRQTLRPTQIRERVRQGTRNCTRVRAADGSDTLRKRFSLGPLATLQEALRV